MERKGERRRDSEVGGGGTGERCSKGAGNTEGRGAGKQGNRTRGRQGNRRTREEEGGEYGNRRAGGQTHSKTTREISRSVVQTKQTKAMTMVGGQSGPRGSLETTKIMKERRTPGKREAMLWVEDWTPSRHMAAGKATQSRGRQHKSEHIRKRKEERERWGG